MSKLSHLDGKGQAHMVDVSLKDATTRSATARGRVLMLAETVGLLRDGLAKKGDVLARLDAAPYQFALAQAEGTAGQIRANASKAEAGNRGKEIDSALEIIRAGNFNLDTAALHAK